MPIVQTGSVNFGTPAEWGTAGTSLGFSYSGNAGDVVVTGFAAMATTSGGSAITLPPGLNVIATAGPAYSAFYDAWLSAVWVWRIRPAGSVGAVTLTATFPGAFRYNGAEAAWSGAASFPALLASPFVSTDAGGPLSVTATRDAAYGWGQHFRTNMTPTGPSTVTAGTLVTFSFLDPIGALFLVGEEPARTGPYLGLRR